MVTYVRAWPVSQHSVCYQYTVHVSVNISVSVDTDMEKVIECGRADTVDLSLFVVVV